VIYDRKLVAALEELAPNAWEGVAFRHMFDPFPPERQNSRGARWNPPETPAIYTSLERTTALAEANYYIDLQPLRPRATRTLYRLNIALQSTLNLTDWSVLETLGVDKSSFSSQQYIATQMIGGAAEWLRHDGILVPSARTPGINLVVFPNHQSSTYFFEVLDLETVSDG
jgi:RES domain-containing protein